MSLIQTSILPDWHISGHLVDWKQIQTPNTFNLHVIITRRLKKYRVYCVEEVGNKNSCKQLKTTFSYKLAHSHIEKVQNFVDKLPKHGDIIGMKRKHYIHYAVYDATRREILEYTQARIQATPFLKLLCREVNTDIIIREFKDGYPPDEVVDRARSQLGKKKFHVYLCNCEHFSVWAKTVRLICCFVDILIIGKSKE